VSQATDSPQTLKGKIMANKNLIEALKKELKHYETYGKAERAEQVKKAIKAAGGKVETKTAKPKAEKKVEKKK
jgi:hypothetical protein